MVYLWPNIIQLWIGSARLKCSNLLKIMKKACFKYSYFILCQCVSEHVYIWTYRRMNVCMVWMYGHMNIVWTYKCMDIWTHERMDIRTYVRISVWTYGRMNILIYERIRVWTYVSMNIWTYVSMNITRAASENMSTTIWPRAKTRQLRFCKILLQLV